MLVAGPLRERVAIQTVTKTQDVYGDPTEAWATAETVHASVKPLRGSEFWSAQQVQSEMTHMFRMRYTSNATPQARLSWDSRTFEILAVKDADPMYKGAERKTFIEVHTKEMITT